MKRFYSKMIALVAMMCVTLTAGAWSFDLPEDNTVLQSEEYNMRLYKNMDFCNAQVNGEPIEGGITFDPNLTTEEIKFNGYVPYRCASDLLPNLWCATSTPNYSAGRGLITNGSGPRGLFLSNMKAGQIIVIQGANGGYNTGETNAEYNGFCIPNGSRYSGNTGWKWEYFEPLQVRDISDSIHNKQDEGLGPEDDPVHDHFLYLRVIQDGWVSIPMERAATIVGIQVWIDAAAKEAVTAPTLTLARVDGVNREVAFKPGESTFGNECSTWYGFPEDDGGTALYLIDTEEIDHYDYVYQLDEEGNKVLDEEGNPIVVEEIPVYKKILDPAAAADGSYGDNLFEGGTVTVLASDDKDGDGYVTIEAATVSSSGAYSDIVALKVSVGDIILNAPSLTLTGMDGLSRKYKIGWTNNTLCGEEFTISAECDGDLTDGLAVGSYIEANNTITVKVEVAGYVPGEQTITVEKPGVKVYRKDAAKAEAGLHDWDFVNISEEQMALFKGLVEKCYLIEDGDTIWYSAEEYEAATSLDGTVDLSGATPVYKDTGWWLPIDKNRTTLNVIEGGNDQNANGYGYVEDQIGIFTGLQVSCPPNTSNNSCIFKYIDKADGDGSDGITQLGVYFMDRPTITFPRETARYGEYVLIYQGAGGSNYTTSRWPSFYTVPADELLSVTLDKGGIHVFYIDVITTEEVASMDDPFVDGIEQVVNRTNVKDNVYSVDGRLVRRQAATFEGLQPGLYIMNGKKYLVK